MGVLGHLVDWSLRNRVIVIAATLLMVALGVRAARRLPIDAIPDITNVQVQVITSAPALSPLEVEQYVSIPVERALQGIPRTTEVRSLSRYGVSVVTVVFEETTDIYFARQLVTERMGEVRDAIPQGYGEPQIGPISTGMGEIYQFTVRNPAMNLMQLEELVDWEIRPRLRSVPGVVEVNTFGGEDREYEVMIDPALLQASGLSIRDVADALEKSNANAGGGYIERDREHFVIGTDGLVGSREDLRDVVLGATPQGAPITVGSIGEVQFAARLRRGAVSMDGEGEVVGAVALMLMGENPRTVTAAIKTRLAEIEESLPEGTTIEPYYDRSELVERTIETAITNLVEGAALVMLVLFLLLGNFRAGIIVAVVIPLSMLFALVWMDVLGLSGNLMSLGALDFGIIVDGAVIVVENVVRRLSERARDGPLDGARRIETVREATMEVRRPTVYGEIVIAIVYVPVLLLQGVEGKLFRPMASTVVLALAGAFILSLTLVPVLASLLLEPKAGHRETWLMRAALWIYRPVIDRLMRLRALTLVGGVAVLAGAVLLFMRLGAEFVPQLDEGDVLVEARRLPGVALTETVQHDLRLERALLEIPQVEHVVSRAGSPELATDAMGIEQSDVYILLSDRESWPRGLTKEDVAAEVAAKAEEAVPEVAGAISQPIQMRTNELVAGVRSDVGILVYGPDLDRLVQYGDEILAAVRDIPGVQDARAEQVAGLRYLRIVPDRAKLARYGLTIADVNIVTEAMAVGRPTGVVLERDRRFTIRVKLSHSPKGDLEALASLPLRAMDGAVVPLGDVAELRFVEGPAIINREALSRRLVVEFNVRGRDMVSVVDEAERAIRDHVELPTGYHIQWGGTFVHYEDAKARLLWLVPLVVACIAMLLWSAFRDWRPALLIFLNVPFAVVGAVLALWLRGIPFSISAAVGFIALFGVAVLNGLVLMTFTRQHRKRGEPPAEAVRNAAVDRLRPVLMTALIDIVGFVPMAISTAPGSEVQRPLATVVIGGIVSATLLTLVLLPVVYATFAGRGRR